MPPLPQPRLVSNVVSERAKNAPGSIWASIPMSPYDASGGYEDITFARLNYAITRAARWLQDTLGRETSMSSRVLAYIGPPDTRYIILTIAAIKTGFTMFFLSPRNSEEAQHSVIEQASSDIFLCSRSSAARVEKLRQSHPILSVMAQYIVPEQEDLLADEFVPDFPYERTIEKARSEALVILHTSSTTGIPKIIPLNQGYGMHEDVVQHIPAFEGLDIITRKPFYPPCRLFVAMPLYHAGGVLLTLLKSLYHGITSVFQPSSAALSAEVFDDILRHGRCTGCVIPPYLLEEMLSNPSHFDTLTALDFVQFGSGPLTQSAGQALLKRQKNCPHFIGSSECGLFILLELDDPIADWQYFRFHPWSGADMRPVDGSNETFELVIVRSDSPAVPGIQPVFELFPDLKEWPTKDLYIRHPSKPDHWRCIGRNDDVMVLSNGEKLNPVDIEGDVAGAHPSITGVLMVGHGRFIPGLLLEVRGVDTSDPSERTRLIDEIWPMIQAANRNAPGHGQLGKELILFATADKPFLRTPKLSLRRRPTIESYANEIDRMYEQYEHGLDASESVDLGSLDLNSMSDIQTALSKYICSVAGWDAQPEDDLFTLGMDSLQVLRTTRMVKTALVNYGVEEHFNAGLLYGNPTIRGISEVIFKMVHASSATDSKVTPTDEETMEALIEKYSHFDLIPTAQTATTNGSQADHVHSFNVVVTGSTGSLGCFILLALLAKPNVCQVFCVNRTKDAGTRQRRAFADRGIDVSQLDGFESRVHFLHSTSLADPELGLTTPGMYDSLKNSNVTHVIHNAWPVNFNMSIGSFESSIAGVRALVDFCGVAATTPQLVFISSLSSVTSMTEKQIVPEAIVRDPSAPSRMGYGQSKYVAERVLNDGTETSQGNISTVILRVGQIAGPVKRSKAAWPLREWLPSLVISSKTLRALPKSLGRMERVDWVPVDLCADGIVELLDVEKFDKDNNQGDTPQSSVLHVVNPTAVTWADLLAPLKAHGDISRTVSLNDWIDLVRQGPEADSTVQRNPAKKILPFYEALTRIANSNTDASTGSMPEERIAVGAMARCSETFKHMPSVSGDWLVQWAGRWL